MTTKFHIVWYDLSIKCYSPGPLNGITKSNFVSYSWWYYKPGPCITNVFATCRKNFSQWHRSFQRKLRSHWLKFLRHVAITLVIQGPVPQFIPWINHCSIFNPPRSSMMISIMFLTSVSICHLTTTILFAGINWDLKWYTRMWNHFLMKQ